MHFKIHVQQLVLVRHVHLGIYSVSIFHFTHQSMVALENPYAMHMSCPFPTQRLLSLRYFDAQIRDTLQYKYKSRLACLFGKNATNYLQKIQIAKQRTTFSMIFSTPSLQKYCTNSKHLFLSQFSLFFGISLYSVIGDYFMILRLFENMVFKQNKTIIQIYIQCDFIN